MSRGKRPLVAASGALVVMGSVTSGVINELHGGPLWWIAAGALTVTSAGLAMWIAGRSDPALEPPAPSNGQTIEQSTVGRDAVQIQHVDNLYLHPEPATPRREQGAPSALTPTPAPAVPTAAEAVPGPAVTDRWRAPADWSLAGALHHLGDNTLDHPSFSGPSPADPAPPSIRLGVVLACDRLPADTPSTSELRARFLRFLDQPAIADLLADLTHVPADAAWRSWSGNGRHSLCAVLPDADGADQTPLVAWARMNMPMPDPTGLQDPRFAEFVLVVEPRTVDGSPAAALALAAWPERMTRMLAVPGLLAHFLADGLHLTTHSQPPTQAGIWLHTSLTLSALVDHTGHEALPGTRPQPWFTAVCLADPVGVPAAAAAVGLVRQLCDHSLGLTDYESIFDAPSAQPTVQPSGT